MAEKVAWEPIKSGGGASFRTQRLIETDGERWEYRLTGGGLAFALAMGFGKGAIAIVAAIVAPEWMAPIAGGAGALFLGAGVWNWKHISKTAAFDWEAARSHSGWESLTLDPIHAWQLITHLVKMAGNEGAYCSYELDLVEADGERTRVVGQSDADAVSNEAARIAEDLGVPLWDAA